MEFIPRKKVNEIFPFRFHKDLQSKMDDVVLTNSAFSIRYLDPRKMPGNTKAQKKLFNSYDKVDENMKKFRKDNFMDVRGNTYLVIGTAVPLTEVAAYDKKAAKQSYALANPGQVMVQYLDENGNNILNKDTEDSVINKLSDISIDDPNIRVFTYMPNMVTYGIDLKEVKL